MATYHQRRPEKTITDEVELLEIIDGQGFMTLAMCKDNEPYLVTVNYGYEPDKRCFYFHCARQGKKMDFMQANPVLWGQIVEDNGYIDGECDHAFRSVEFRGRVTRLEGDDARRHAIGVMIDHLESDPAEVKKRFDKPEALAKAVVMRVDVEQMTGKKNPIKKG
jgi:hypothetical protein